jgi:hypothetical protein
MKSPASIGVWSSSDCRPVERRSDKTVHMSGRGIGLGLLVAVSTVTLSPPWSAAQPTATTPIQTPVVAKSVALGSPTRGSLRNAVNFPFASDAHYTWDPGRQATPSDDWRRWGTEWTVAATLCVLGAYRAAYPDRPRVLVGDISREQGGEFGREWGGPGHATHQNGLDVDIYYPRKDRYEVAPFTLKEVDWNASQELVRRFEQAGATVIYVGRRTPLRGQSKVVERVRKHENHLHVRFPNLSQRRWMLTETCAPVAVALPTTSLVQPTTTVLPPSSTSAT